MSRLPEPVREVLREPIDDVAAQRMWRAIETRRGGRSTRARLGYLAAAAAAVVVLVLAFRGAPPAAPPAPGPLTLADGHAFVTLTSPGDHALSDGSLVSLDPGARVEVLDASAGSLVLLQPAGRATYDVAGARRWSVECGVATVEASAARFAVTTTGTRARVDVERGAVLVRGERVAGRVRRVQAGDFLEIDGEAKGADADPPPAPRAAEPPASASAAAPAPPPPAPPSSSAKLPPAPASSSWRDLARTGAYDNAYGELGASGIARATDEDGSVDDLMALADVARLSGHPADAVRPLTRVMTAHAGDPRASLAAFTLGRIELDNLGQPAAAASAFAAALALGLPRGLVEDAQARLVEARARAGDGAGARAAAVEYERAFPHGAYLAKVHRWAGAP